MAAVRRAVGSRERGGGEGEGEGGEGVWNGVREDTLVHTHIKGPPVLGFFRHSRRGE